MGRVSILPHFLSISFLSGGGVKKRRRREESLALRRGEVKKGEERRGDFNIETCPPADSGSFCEAVGREGVSEGMG